MATSTLPSYEQTLEFLYARLPMFSRIGAAAYKPSLDNTLRICDFLGNPERKFKSVHIAGTNGKGSVSHMLAAIFQEAGYKTGLYTSPHLRDFRERIRINGQMIDPESIVRHTETLRTLINQIEPSFFELTVGMAFACFAEQEVDIAIIETGLGGRLDSTNVILPELSIITQIGMDHMNLLGDRIELIAGEKAGIIKPNIPVVLGEVLSETLPVFEQKARELQAPLYIAPHHWQATDWYWKTPHLFVEVEKKGYPDRHTIELDLGGLYQVKNLLTVLAACQLLQQSGWNLSPEVQQRALRQVKKLTGLHGRWEVIQQHPMVVLDVAHNEDGIHQLVEQIELTDYFNLHIVLGVVKDKDVDRVLYQLPRSAKYYFTQASIPRALDADTLRELAAGYNLEGGVYEHVNQALAAARQAAHTKDLIIVCGSVFLVGELHV